jgi:hypothetical protein
MQPPNAGALLPFLSLTIGDQAQTANAMGQIELQPGEYGLVEMTFDPDDPSCGEGACSKWSGELEISSPAGNGKRVGVSYYPGKKSLWTGAMVYFGAFPRGADWDEEANPTTISFSGSTNALIQQFYDFQLSNNTVNDYANLAQALTAAKNDSWVQGDSSCDAASGQPASGACNACRKSPDGLSCIGTSGEMPSGALEMPFEARLDFSDSGGSYVVTSGMLHYSGDPVVTVDRAENEVDGLRDVTEFKIESVVDGRYLESDSDSGCGDGFEEFSVPWLLGVEGDSACPAGVCTERVLTSCRGVGYPFGPTDPERNKNFSVANPVADGSRVVRTLELVGKGIIIDGEKLVALFRETLEFSGVSDIPDAISYGYLNLVDSTVDIGKGTSLPLVSPDPGIVDVYSDRDWCDPAFKLLSDANYTDAVRHTLNHYSWSLSKSQTVDLVNTLMTGTTTPPETQINTSTLTCLDSEFQGAGGDCNDKNYDDPCGVANPPAARSHCRRQSASAEWSVHFLCEATGLFDARCPIESEVTYFLKKETGAALHGELSHSCETSKDSAWHEQVEDYLNAQFNRLDRSSNPTCRNHNDTGNYDPDSPGYLQGEGCAQDTDPEITATTDTSATMPDEWGAKEIETGANNSKVSARLGGSVLPPPANCGETLKGWLVDYPDTYKAARWDCDATVNDASSQDCFQFADLLAGKKFYRPVDEPQTLTPMEGGAGLVNSAFAYVTQFQSSAVGASGALGFMPAVCSASETTGYCYSPEEITEIAVRNECLLYLYTNNPADAFTGDLESVKTYLNTSLGYSTEAGGYGVVKTQSGFEKLYAELLIMIGDDAQTTALSSRFDLAENTIGKFEGSKFEPGGMDLTGLAGGEMRNLYKAAQAYQAVLDRFQRIWILLSHLKKNEPNRYSSLVSAELATSYLGRVIDAAKKKTRVWSLVAKRYHNFTYTDVARNVIERGYTAATLENALITSAMKQVLDGVSNKSKGEIRYKLKAAQIGFSAALTRMRAVYGDLDADLNYFGFTDDYIPFPGLEVGAGRDNGFEVQINRAKDRMGWALNKESTAIETSRTFAFDAAAFFSELEEMENRYESQIIEKCGSFRAEGGEVYPAMMEYYDYIPVVLRTGEDPCGSKVMETGSIFEARDQFEIQLLELDQNNRAVQEKIEQVESVLEHIRASCKTVEGFNQKLKELTIGQMGVEHTMNDARRISELVHESTKGTLAVMDQVARAQVNTVEAAAEAASVAGNAAGLDASGAADAAADAVKEAAQVTYNYTMATATGIGATVDIVASQAMNIAMLSGEEQLRDLAEERFQIEGEQQCAMMAVDGEKQLRDILIGMQSARIEVAQGLRRLQAAGQRVDSLRQGAERLMSELKEVRELSINKQAARNNPNFRIYKDDSVRNAEVAFKKLLTEAYKSTVIFEYHTSQTYAFKEELYLSRMVDYGEYNLQNYIYDLEDAFWEFEDHYGLAELRVLPLSLRKDIFNGMRVAPNGKAFSERDMKDSVQEWLNRSMDETGKAELSFKIGPNLVSPSTRVHKVSYVEACVEKQTAAAAKHPRIYLDMAGTSSVWSLGEEFTDRFYDFGGRPAVVTARWCSGSDYSWDPKIFQSQKFTQRPLFNNQWDLTINFTTEPANAGYGPEQFDELQLFFYYFEFTDF